MVPHKLTKSSIDQEEVTTDTHSPSLYRIHITSASYNIIKESLRGTGCVAAWKREEQHTWTTGARTLCEEKRKNGRDDASAGEIAVLPSIRYNRARRAGGLYA